MGSTTLRRTAVAFAAALCLLGTTSCSSDGGGKDGGGAAEKDKATYLALGDSVPFGYRGGATGDYGDEDNFVGYPELVAEDRDLDLINASCPGETTASFLDAAAQSNGCENSVGSPMGYRTAYPLHVLYGSVTQSQLDFAVKTIEEKKDVELVTVQVGANDAFVCQQTTASKCTALEDLQAVSKTVQDNLAAILSALRSDAGYDGQIVVVTYYALNYNDPTGAAIQFLDGGMAQVAGKYAADVADGYAAFKTQAEAAGGDSIAAGLVLPNDVHPTDQGQQLLADAVTKVLDQS